MIACLRAARLVYPDESASVFVELRRHHDTKAVGERGSHLFTVTKRYSRFPQALSIKRFCALSEARAYWRAQVQLLEDQGLARRDPVIVGFREED